MLVTSVNALTKGISEVVLSQGRHEVNEQIPQSSRWNVLTVERINQLLVMRHAHPACALVELLEIGETPSGPDGVLHDPVWLK
jgi:hypothetical protein